MRSKHLVAYILFTACTLLTFSWSCGGSSAKDAAAADAAAPDKASDTSVDAGTDTAVDAVVDMVSGG